MMLYQLTDKGRELLSKPRHEEPTNWEHCCSCCALLSQENRRLKKTIISQMVAIKGGNNNVSLSE